MSDYREAMGRHSGGTRSGAETGGTLEAESSWARAGFEGVAGTARMQNLLGHVVQENVLPQLQQALGRPLARGPARPRGERGLAPRRAVEARDVARLIALVTSGGPDSARVLIDGLIAHGCDRAAIFSDLLAPAAREIGDQWLDDRCSFTEVTVGVGRLQALLRELALPARPDARRQTGPAVLLAPYPPEQHSFGIAMVEEFFRSAGWRVTALCESSLEEIEGVLARSHVDVLGLSLSCDVFLDGVADGVRRFREASRNRALTVMVGGPALIQDPNLWRELGADGSAADAREAVEQAHELLAKGRSQR